MNRAERRKQKKFLKNKGEPLSHLHSCYSESDLSNMREKIREFLKTYDFNGSLFQADYERELDIKKMFPNSLIVKNISDFNENIMTLEKDFPIENISTKQVIKTDIFLVKEKSGWFIRYSKIPYFQNILISLKEMGFENMLNGDLNVGGSFCGYIIPLSNHILRCAFDRLTLRYGDGWVDL